MPNDANGLNGLLIDELCLFLKKVCQHFITSLQDESLVCTCLDIEEKTVLNSGTSSVVEGC